MKNRQLIAFAAIAISACTTERAPEPALPTGVQTTQFSVSDDSYLRGVNGSSNTSPRGRPAAILDVTYDMTCIADDATSRRDRALEMLDQKYVAAPLFFANPRERGQWRRGANRLAIETGCSVTGLDYTTRTTDQAETTLWALRNRVPPAR